MVNKIPSQVIIFWIFIMMFTYLATIYSTAEKG